MKAEELRIGNYVFGLNMEEPVRRINDSIEYNYKTEKYELDAIDILCFEPILLTEEWLLKFGFYIDSFKNYELGNINIHRLTFKLDIFEDDAWHTIPVKMKYVHQLQNLYFTLTGEELKLK